MVRTSRYLTMRDGVRIAIDVYLPRTLKRDERLPAILHQTRYYRRFELKRPFRWILPWTDDMTRMIRRMTNHGYAVVNVDARGSGASFGTRRMEWSPDEVRDGAEVVNWIVEQPWSSGRVGTTGISYNGTAAEMHLVNQHPAVKAANIQFALFDIYTDILRPGGVYNEGFLREWSALNKALDHGRLPAFARQKMGRLAGLAIEGVAPVDSGTTGSTMQDAVRAHADNYDIYRTSMQVEFSDDRTDGGIGADDFSPHAFMREIEGAGAAIYGWSSWYDGAYTLSAIKRFLNIRSPGSRLILGPWDHGGRQNPDPFAWGHKSRFDQAAETVRFFDQYLGETAEGIDGDPPVRYFTMGEETWKAADTWPPPGFEPTPFYLDEGLWLRRGDPPTGDGADTYQVDHSASSGKASRWATQVNVAQVQIGYPDRKIQDGKLLVYDSAPLERALELTGHPIITLYVRSSATDGQFFVYLEDVTAGGDVHYVTEGVFRARHRKIKTGTPPYRAPVPYHTFRREDAMPLVPGQVVEITFDLQPVSYLFQRGHAIRLAIAGADRDNFEIYPAQPPTIEVQRSQAYPSHILLPIKAR